MNLRAKYRSVQQRPYVEAIAGFTNNAFIKTPEGQEIKSHRVREEH